MDFSAELKKQIGFLRRSAGFFDGGISDESLRIAVSLRVLFHDTNVSTSLLTHLGAWPQTKILSTFVPAYTEDLQTGMRTATIPMWVSTDTGLRKPPLADTQRREFIPAKDWWMEIVMTTNHKLTRKDIVLSASNQDGGAHVDAAPSRKTLELKEGIGEFSSTSRGLETTIKLTDHHLPLIRQFGYEVLNSPDLLALA